MHLNCGPHPTVGFRATQPPSLPSPLSWALDVLRLGPQGSRPWESGVVPQAGPEKPWFVTKPPPCVCLCGESFSPGVEWRPGLPSVTPTEDCPGGGRSEAQGSWNMGGRTVLWSVPRIWSQTRVSIPALLLPDCVTRQSHSACLGLSSCLCKRPALRVGGPSKGGAQGRTPWPEPAPGERCPLSASRGVRARGRRVTEGQGCSWTRAHGRGPPLCPEGPPPGPGGLPPCPGGPPVSRGPSPVSRGLRTAAAAVGTHSPSPGPTVCWALPGRTGTLPWGPTGVTRTRPCGPRPSS